MSRKMTPEQFGRRVEVWLSDLSSHLEKVAPALFARWRARAVSGYMRDAKSEIGTRRDPGDSGPLRILSGTLAGATGAGGPNRPGAIERVRTEGLRRTTLEKGVDLGTVPYARIQELGGRAGRNHAATIPARPYIRPAVEDEKPEIRRILHHSLRESFTRDVAGR